MQKKAPNEISDDDEVICVLMIDFDAALVCASLR